MEGAAIGFAGVISDMKNHPFRTAFNVISPGYALAYNVAQVACNVAGIGLQSWMDPVKGAEQWGEFIAPLNAMISAIRDNKMSSRDIVKGVAQFASSWVTQNKVLGGLENLCVGLRKKAIEFANKNPLVTPQEYMATPEGGLFKSVADSNNPKIAKNGIKDCAGSVIPDFIKFDRVPRDSETILSTSGFIKTKVSRVKGAAIYKKGDRYYHRDTLHKGKGAHLEVYNSRGQHIGEAHPLNGELIPNTVNKTRKIDL
jgi:hypothetical protein